MTKKDIENGKSAVIDILYGDDQAYYFSNVCKLNKKEIDYILNLVLSNPNLTYLEKTVLLANLWRVHYRVKPPTIEEFVDPNAQWLGSVTETLWPSVKKTLLEFWNFESEKAYRHLVLGQAIGCGKSFKSVISNLFVSTHLWCMRDPKKYFGVSPASILCQVLISFTKDKAKELLLKPFINILENSTKFERCRTEDSFRKKQKDYGDNKICWTTAGISALQFANNVDIKIASRVQDLLGHSIILGTISEITFFIEAGFKPDYIWQVYTDLKNRIDNRFKKNFWARTILDSSPNDIDYPIDKYIFNESRKYEENYVETGAVWQYKIEDAVDVTRTFPIFIGNRAKIAAIITEEERKQYNELDIIDVPAYYRKAFEENLIKALKDIGGVPSGKENKLINDMSIIENMFDSRLANLYNYIYVPANQDPENLIWNAIKDIFFIEILPGRFEFYRAPYEPRYIHIDQSKNKDMTGISMCHAEVDNTGKIIQVIDFSIAILPSKKEQINLDANYCLLYDLKYLGNINIKKITFDSYESASVLQRLQRYGFNAERFSVDINIEPYIMFISLMQNKRVKCGKNIILKNNFKSLKDSTTKKGKRKIEHTVGDVVINDNGSWETSSIGINAKDVSDSVVACVYQSMNSNEIPSFLWEYINIEYQKNNNYNSDEAMQSSELIRKEILNKLSDRFNFIVK